jgi:DNA ligase-associated metallophosphoesterase
MPRRGPCLRRRVLTMGHEFTFGGADLIARPSGALHWPERGLLVISDLHLGKSARLARRGGALIPPYETRATLDKLAQEIHATDAAQVMALGDSFDDLEAADGLDEAEDRALKALMEGREWTWVEGNHDPGAPGPYGVQAAEITLEGIHFRHIGSGPGPEISGHLHPKARLAGRSHPCFILGDQRLILPAFGTYTGGLWITDPLISTLFPGPARAILTGTRARVIPLPGP